MKFLIFLIFLIIERKVEAGGSSQGSSCGTFIPYDPKTQPNLPATHGFSAGTLSDGSQLYVGTGTSDCGSDLAAHLSVGNETAPGAYVNCNGQEIHDADSPKYLQNFGGLDWIAAFALPSDIPGAISTTKDGSKNEHIARIILTCNNGTTFLSIASILSNDDSFSSDNGNSTNEDCVKTVEILVCN